MIALFLDMENDEVRIVTVNGLQDYYRLIGCDCIEIANREIRGKRFDIICDDEGLLKAEPQVSAVNGRGRSDACRQSYHLWRSRRRRKRNESDGRRYYTYPAKYLDIADS